MNLDIFFSPRATAVVGASLNPRKVGHMVVQNLVQSGYRGKILPINPKGGQWDHLPIYPTLQAAKEAEGPIDLAVVAVPAEKVVQIAKEAGDAGVGGLLVLTAGFREIGPAGKEREEELLSVVRQYSMRLLGPNVVGTMDMHVPFNATFAAGFPPAGDVAFISQSGALLLAILDYALGTNLGFSRFASIGNKADVDETDLLENLLHHDQTRVILMYLEDIKRGPKFLQVASRVTREKPVVVLKSGRSAAGAKAAASHTGALAGSDRAYEAALRQSGVVRVDTMDELFLSAWAFRSPRYPKGKRVAILTNAGGGGILASDAVEKEQLQLAPLALDTKQKLRQFLPAESSVENPVDVLGDADAARYEKAFGLLTSDPHVDGLVVILCPADTADPQGTADVLLHKNPGNFPVVAAFMGGEGVAEGAALLQKGGIPTYAFPEEAVGALARLYRYGFERQKEAADPLALPKGWSFPAAAQKVLEKAAGENRKVLLPAEALRVAESFGIPVAAARLATSAKEAGDAAETLGYPVALKISSPDILHKSDVGGVQLGLKDRRAVEKAYTAIMEGVERRVPGAALYGVEVQRMLPQGVEALVGMTRDPTFGPLLVVGLGGIFVNLLQEAAFRLVEIVTAGDLAQMIQETRLGTLLRGFRGSPPADEGAFLDLLQKVALMLQGFPQLLEMDLNPVLVGEKGAWVVDAKMTIQ
ncbi:MAG: acetate--CoA ligase family protein [Bacillota bacterium]|nr:acetate--CoA ligase family protein [Bacillota bacterium]